MTVFISRTFACLSLCVCVCLLQLRPVLGVSRQNFACLNTSGSKIVELSTNIFVCVYNFVRVAVNHHSIRLYKSEIFAHMRPDLTASCPLTDWWAVTRARHDHSSLVDTLPQLDPVSALPSLKDSQKEANLTNSVSN